MKILKVAGLASLLALNLSACSKPIETTEELSVLPIEGYAVKACEAFEDLHWEQLEHMFSESELSNFERQAEKAGSTSALKALIQSKVSCDKITNIETDKNRYDTQYKAHFDNFYLKITHKDNAYSVRGVRFK